MVAVWGLAAFPNKLILLLCHITITINLYLAKDAYLVTLSPSASSYVVIWWLFSVQGLATFPLCYFVTQNPLDGQMNTPHGDIFYYYLLLKAPQLPHHEKQHL